MGRKDDLRDQADATGLDVPASATIADLEAALADVADRGPMVEIEVKRATVVKHRGTLYRLEVGTNTVPEAVAHAVRVLAPSPPEPDPADTISDEST